MIPYNDFCAPVFGTVPALRCTAEEALHRVRDTRDEWSVL